MKNDKSRILRAKKVCAGQHSLRRPPADFDEAVGSITASSTLLYTEYKPLQALQFKSRLGASDFFCSLNFSKTP